MRLSGSNKKSAALFFLLTFFFLQLPAAQAAVPKLMTYQGVLKDGSGNFLTGTYSMTFKLYSASSGGSALWTETQSSVSASSGKFSVQLGSVTALNLDFNTDYWLSMQVGSDAEMSPRIRLTSMGYGIRADYENNGFTQGSHDALSHKNTEGFKELKVDVAKTNFKLDAYSLASANSMGDLIVDAFNDSTGINSGASSNYVWRGSSNYDVVVTPGGLDSYVKLALHTNGSNASTTFTDSSGTSKTVTANGDAQISTAQSKFGGASGLLDGSGDYLTTPSHSDWNFGTGDFTIDFWVRTASQSIQTAIGMEDGAWLVIWNGATNMSFYKDTNTAKSWTTTSRSNNTWYHFAFVRSGNTLYFFQDGVSQGSHDITGWNIQTSNALQIGRWSPWGTLNGNMDEIRISKGIARWTSNFTPPSAEYSSGGVGTATVISNAYSEPTAPTEAMVIADETLNSGSITYYVSRDNGTTWTACTKETVTSISSQPSGTQLKWKASITGDAELNAIAVSV